MRDRGEICSLIKILEFLFPSDNVMSSSIPFQVMRLSCSKEHVGIARAYCKSEEHFWEIE